MSLEERIKSEQQAMRPITNADTVCKDCIYAFDDTKIPGNISHCAMYKDEWKPNNIIFHGADCKYHKKSGE